MVVPADALELWSEQRLDEGLEHTAVCLGYGKVQEPERAGDHRPYARVFLALETPHQGEELLHRRRAGQCTGPSVRHELEPLQRLEPVEAGEDAVEQLVLIAKSVNAATSDVDHQHPLPGRDANGLLAEGPGGGWGDGRLIRRGPASAWPPARATSSRW